MKIKNALKNENITFDDLYYALENEGIGCWDNINYTDVIKEYIIEQIKEDISVSHMLAAIEEGSSTDVWEIWLGSSMETPYPVESKESLVEALELSEKDLEIDINL